MYVCVCVYIYIYIYIKRCEIPELDMVIGAARKWAGVFCDLIAQLAYVQ